jgi:hypothetical protein
VENAVGSGSILEIRFSSDEISMQYKLNTLFGKGGQEMGYSNRIGGMFLRKSI